MLLDTRNFPIKRCFYAVEFFEGGGPFGPGRSTYRCPLYNDGGRLLVNIPTGENAGWVQVVTANVPNNNSPNDPRLNPLSSVLYFPDWPNTDRYLRGYVYQNSLVDAPAPVQYKGPPLRQLGRRTPRDPQALPISSLGPITRTSAGLYAAWQRSIQLNLPSVMQDSLRRQYEAARQAGR